jgi:hypothetical protein
MVTSHDASICCVCECSLDENAPHEMLGQKRAHIDCADTLANPGAGQVGRRKTSRAAEVDPAPGTGAKI